MYNYHIVTIGGKALVRTNDPKVASKEWEKIKNEGGKVALYCSPRPLAKV